MIIKLHHTIVDVDVLTDTNRTIMEEIRSILETQGHQLGYLIVDGESIYENYEEIIDLNIKSISEIKIVAVGDREWSIDILSASNSYLINAIPNLNELGAQFHLGEEDISWTRFQQFLDGVEWVRRVLGTILPYTNEQFASFLTSKFEEVQQLISQLLDSLEDKDRALTGDLIQYEFSDLYQSLQAGIQDVLVGAEIS